MKNLKIYSVATEKTGYGHWRVTLDLSNGTKISSVTTNSQAIDAEDDVTLADEVCRKNEVDESGEMIEYDYSEVESQKDILY